MHAPYTNGVLLLQHHHGGGVRALATIPTQHRVTGLVVVSPRLVAIADGPDVLICACAADRDWRRAVLRRVQVGLADDPDASRLPRPMAVWDETVVVADFGVWMHCALVASGLAATSVPMSFSAPPESHQHKLYAQIKLQCPTPMHGGCT